MDYFNNNDKAIYKSLALSLLDYFEVKSPKRSQIRTMEMLLTHSILVVEHHFNKKLAKREIQCLRLAAQGFSTSETAKLLKISPKTVEKHRKNINKKLHCKNITQAVTVGFNYGYTRDNTIENNANGGFPVISSY